MAIGPQMAIPLRARGGALPQYEQREGDYAGGAGVSGRLSDATEIAGQAARVEAQGGEAMAKSVSGLQRPFEQLAGAGIAYIGAYNAQQDLDARRALMEYQTSAMQYQSELEKRKGVDARGTEKDMATFLEKQRNELSKKYKLDPRAGRWFNWQTYQEAGKYNSWASEYGHRQLGVEYEAVYKDQMSVASNEVARDPSTFGANVGKILVLLEQKNAYATGMTGDREANKRTISDVLSAGAISAALGNGDAQRANELFAQLSPYLSEVQRGKLNDSIAAALNQDHVARAKNGDPSALPARSSGSGGYNDMANHDAYTRNMHNWYSGRLKYAQPGSGTSRNLKDGTTDCSGWVGAILGGEYYGRVSEDQYNIALKNGGSVDLNELKKSPRSGVVIALDKGPTKSGFDKGRALGIDHIAVTYTDANGKVMVSEMGPGGVKSTSVDAWLAKHEKAGHKMYAANARAINSTSLVRGKAAGLVGDVSAKISEMATKYGVDPKLAMAVAMQESRGDLSAESGKGARGVFQLMPATFRALMPNGDINDPNDNIEAGIKYLAQMRQKYGNDEDALLAYNWGPGNVDAYKKTGKGAKGQDIPAEAKNYADGVRGFMATPQRQDGQTFSRTQYGNGVTFSAAQMAERAAAEKAGQLKRAKEDFLGLVVQDPSIVLDEKFDVQSFASQYGLTLEQALAVRAEALQEYGTREHSRLQREKKAVRDFTEGTLTSFYKSGDEQGARDAIENSGLSDWQKLELQSDADAYFSKRKQAQDRVAAGRFKERLYSGEYATQDDYQNAVNRAYDNNEISADAVEDALREGAQYYRGHGFAKTQFSGAFKEIRKSGLYNDEYLDHVYERAMREYNEFRSGMTDEQRRADDRALASSNPNESQTAKFLAGFLEKARDPGEYARWNEQQEKMRADERGKKVSRAFDALLAGDDKTFSTFSDDVQTEAKKRLRQYRETGRPRRSLLTSNAETTAKGGGGSPVILNFDEPEPVEVVDFSLLRGALSREYEEPSQEYVNPAGRRIAEDVRRFFSPGGASEGAYLIPEGRTKAQILERTRGGK